MRTSMTRAVSEGIAAGRAVVHAGSREVPVYAGSVAEGVGTDVEGAMFRLDQPIVITIDGPAGTGKSSVARLVARALGLDFLDTGAMYRAAAAIMLDEGLDLADADRLVDRVKQADLHFDWTTDPPAILAFGRAMGDRIRDQEVTSVVSPVARIAPLRAHMVQKQRIIARQHPRLVTEGRDQGSVVFPDATVKFYLDADPAERARRRAAQLRERGEPASEEALLHEIIERDRSDMSRKDGPLVRPADAIVVDTSALSLDQVVAALRDEVIRLSRA